MRRTMKLGIVMDPIAGINPQKDSSLAMLLAAAARGWETYYMEPGDLFLRGAILHTRTRRIEVQDKPQAWYRLAEARTVESGFFDCILMRKDPPVNIAYIHATWLLEQSEAPVFNDPAGLREINEKLFITRFPDCICPCLVSSEQESILDFVQQHGEVVLKPLDSMGGEGVFRSHSEDDNLRVIIETLSAHGTRHIMVQQYIPEIRDGDKRILLIDGEPVPFSLARVPARNDFRGNLVKGAHGEGRELGKRDRQICDRVGKTLSRMNILFCGLDVIGDFLTEINVTSPTGIRELDAHFDLDIGDRLMDAILSKQRR